jgi:hypothetical protein
MTPFISIPGAIAGKGCLRDVFTIGMAFGFADLGGTRLASPIKFKIAQSAWATSRRLLKNTKPARRGSSGQTPKFEFPAL